MPHATQAAQAAALCCAMALPASAEVPTFDPATNLVRIPSVSVGADTYTSVTLRHQGDYVFTLQDFTPQVPAAPGIATYDTASALLSLPAVRVGEQTYLDVTLRNTGNFTFALQGATALAPALLDQVRATMASYDSLYANGLPSPTQAVSLYDQCWRHDGIDRSWVAAGHYAGGQDEIGRLTRNIQVAAVRSSVNTDGSARQEVDIEYDINHADGTVTRGAKNTLISGSSAGTLRCPSAQADERLRLLGNQAWAAVAVGSRTVRAEGYSISTGAPLSPPVVWRRDIQFWAIDPIGHSNYAVVSGPGLGSRKLLSPRLLRTAPELAGKRGNYLNIADDHPFMICRAPGNAVPLADVADCVGEGASGYDHGFSTATPNAAADANFAALGYLAGGAYRFDLYDDDGWKTVNGHAGRTPLSTRHVVLDHLGLPFGLSTDVLPELRPQTLTMAQLQANVVSPAPVPVAFQWGQLGALPPGRAYALYYAWGVHQGPRTGNAAGAAWPAYRTIETFTPGPSATSYPAWPVLPLNPNQASKTYTDFTLQYRERGTAHEILSVIVMQ